jgi:hypothetical protein
MGKPNRYSQIIEQIFLARYKKGMREVPFKREDFARVASDLNVTLPKNLGDLIYTFRYRVPLPSSVRNTAPKGQAWVIRGAGSARYLFALTADHQIAPREALIQTKIPDATPGIVATYALNDEQALLAKVRYNRLIDIFTGVVCYSLQNHLRTTVPGMGQVETDELYIGVDKSGIQYVFPVQAKGGNDKHSVVQIEQDFALCRNKFPRLVCRAIGAQFMGDDVIALFCFEETDSGVSLSFERHYRLVPPDKISDDDLIAYRSDLPRE